jgi:hypothetical protein
MEKYHTRLITYTYKQRSYLRDLKWQVSHLCASSGSQSLTTDANRTGGRWNRLKCKTKDIISFERLSQGVDSFEAPHITQC